MTLSARAVLIAPALMLMAACSTSPLSSIGSLGSLGSNKVSDTDRVYLIAAGSWDRNRDNVVTCDEWKAYAAELFNGADANRDDFVDADEWKSIVAIDRMFVTADTAYFDGNRDGKVGRGEFIDKPNPAFALMDTGKTCALSGAQIAGARSKTEYDVSGKKKEEGPTDLDDAKKGRGGAGGGGY